MRALALTLVLAPAALAPAQVPKAPAPPPTFRSTLLDQLRATHTKEEWFVPVNIADAGFTPEQARWIPTSNTPNPAPADHSVGMLTYHLLFWNANALARMKGEKPGPPPADNRDTFNKFDASNWPATAAKLDAVLTEMESLVANASDAQLAQWSSTIQHFSAHNAYHTGQMIEIRKLQGSWDPAKGVK
ncbi:MAG: DinB family protein [Acidobacteriota bacterium]|nr:DinB family protein [Acidobacteriota bacterium]